MIDESKSKKGVGRNDPCPCGSGKKYKKCCWGKPNIFTPKLPPSQPDKLKAQFESYNQVELVATLGGLQVYPPNHCHTVRLELATRLACSIKRGGKNQVKPKSFQRQLNEYLPTGSSVGMMEDPPENLFTENIIFHGGNYVVYPGIAEGGTFILRTLFESIFHQGPGLSKQFTAIATAAAVSLLTLSNEVAARLGHVRYMDSPDNWRKDIEVPELGEMERLAHAVQFTSEKMGSLLNPLDLDAKILRPFTLAAGDEQLTHEDPMKNPLLTKPFVKIGDLTVLALPGSVNVALRHFIWVLAGDLGLREELASRFRKTLFLKTQEYLRLMFLTREVFPLPASTERLPIEESTYNIDTNKAAYVQLIVDDARDYVRDEPYGRWDTGDLGSRLDTRAAAVAEKMRRHNPVCQLFLITVVGGIGRWIGFGRGEQRGFDRSLSLSVEDLQVLAQLRKCDSLSLWKYAEAKERLRKSPHIPQPIVVPSFLDPYALYLDRDHSFDLSDEEQPSFIYIHVGYGRRLRVEAARSTDVHAALIGDPPHYISVCRRDADETIPIYVPEDNIGRSLQHLIEGYAQPIWVEPQDQIEQMTSEAKEVYFGFTDMMAYWVWQMTPSLRTHLECLSGSPIDIQVRLESPTHWFNPIEKDTDEERGLPQIASEVGRRSVAILIPHGFQPYLHSADNQGERMILLSLLQGLGEMIQRSGHRNTLDGSVRDRIVETHAPVGRKKKFFLVDTEKTVALSPKNLPTLRKLQDHDIQEQLDELVEQLGEHAPPIGEVLDKRERINLCNNIVDVYLRRLRSLISKFNWLSLLQDLIARNEVVMHHAANERVTVPTTLECFGDLESQVMRVMKESLANDKTALSTRSLIELVAAEPPIGNSVIGAAELDTLLAMMYLLVDWAVLSDQIRFGIFDHRIRVLPNGRIGVHRDTMQGVWDPFLSAKSLESVESAITGFEGYFQPDSKSTTPHEPKPEVESAFKAEFGLTLTQAVEFHVCLTNLAFSQRSSTGCLRLSKFKEKATEFLAWTTSEIDKSIDLFSLRPREKWDRAPSGFADRDVWPWRYNRRLSYLRRPLVIGPGEDPMVLWGPRHAEKSGLHLLSLVLKGRYKTHDHSSKEMIKLIREIQGNAGKEFVLDVKKWFCDNTDWSVDSQVPIRPGARLSAEDNLGDVDVLAIDKENDRIFSIECKNVKYARNPSELANELECVMGDSQKRTSWVVKHNRRGEWLKGNVDLVCSAYEVELRFPRVYSIILTAQEIPSTYVRTVDLPCIPFTRLKREGVRCLCAR